MSNVDIVTEHVEQLLDIYASNPSYNSRAVFLLTDDLVELMLRSHIKSWRQRNPGIMSDPENFVQACFFTIATWASKASIDVRTVKANWEALEPNPIQRWRGAHVSNVQESSEYQTMRTRCHEEIDALESALTLHQERNKLYHDPSYMRLAPGESTVCSAINNLLIIGKTLFPGQFEQKLRSQPLSRALFAWFHLHTARYSNDRVRRSLEECLCNQPSFGLDKLTELNRQEIGWLFVKDPDFGHSWMLIHHDSTTFAQALEQAACEHRLIRRRTR